MTNILRTAVLAFVLGFACPAMADPYFVSGVEVDVTAESATEAQRIAHAEAQRRALGYLFRALVLRADRPRLPDFSDREVADLVAAFTIDEEKTSARRYLATLSVRFKRDAVRALLRVLGIPFSETEAKPTLILPVYEAAGTRVLWEQPNPWRDAFARLELERQLRPLALAEGDFQDMMALTADQAVAGERGRVRVLERRYGLDDAVVALARLTFDLTTDTPILTVTTTDMSDDLDRVTVETFRGDSRESLDALIRESAAAVASRLDDEWKAETLLQFENELMLAAWMEVHDLSDWLDMRRELSEVAMIRQIELASLNVRDAEVVLRYMGTPRQLALSLAQRDIKLVNAGGYWTLAKSEAP